MNDDLFECLDSTPPHDREQVSDEVWKVFGQNFEGARISAGWKHQYQFEDHFGLGRSTLSPIEKGIPKISTETFVFICKCVCLRPDGLLGLPAATVPEGAPSNSKGVYWKESIGPRVHFLRERSGLSLAKFGKLIGKSGGMISNIEQGVRFPSMKSLLALCSHFKVPMWWLLGFPSFS